MRDFKTEKEVEEFYQSSGKSIIIFEDTIYDVSSYMKLHPGGSDLVE
jgi:cytochrome b involved in lipid metabolism